MPPGYGRPVTTSPRDQARLNDALDELTDALEAHLAACIESTGEADAAVQDAYTALRLHVAKVAAPAGRDGDRNVL